MQILAQLQDASPANKYYYQHDSLKLSRDNTSTMTGETLRL